jgi:hypothetical protein
VVLGGQNGKFKRLSRPRNGNHAPGQAVAGLRALLFTVVGNGIISYGDTAKILDCRYGSMARRLHEGKTGHGFDTIYYGANLLAYFEREFARPHVIGAVRHIPFWSEIAERHEIACAFYRASDQYTENGGSEPSSENCALKR